MILKEPLNISTALKNPISSKEKLYEIWGHLTFGNQSIQISTEATGLTFTFKEIINEAFIWLH